LLSYFSNLKDGVIIYEEIPKLPNLELTTRGLLDAPKFAIEVLNWNIAAKKLLHIDTTIVDSAEKFDQMQTDAL
jgi:hypothetical protein